MSPDQRLHVRKALEGLDVHPAAPGEIATLLTGSRSSDYFHASISSDMIVSRFSRDGAKAIADLAKSIRDEVAEKKRGVSGQTLQAVIAKQLVLRFKQKNVLQLAEEEIDAFGHAIDEWFKAHNRTQRHLIPCAILPRGGPRFILGPITFFHMSEFRPEDYGVSSADVSVLGELYFERLFRLMTERSSNWIAEVEVAGREQRQSILAANLAVDVALGGLQSVTDNAEFYRIHRATARAMPAWRTDVWVPDGGPPSQSLHNDTPGVAIDPQAFASWLETVKPVMASMGVRLSAYLAGTGTTPRLDEAWCGAAYWYHEALAETLDTVRIAKLETSMEILFGAESSKKSNSRLIAAFDAFFGLSANQAISKNTQLTVKDFVASIVRARSRVLHGTWPTFAAEVPEVTFADVNFLARNLLMFFTLDLDRYIAAGSMDDNTESFLDWVKANGQTRPS